MTYGNCLECIIYQVEYNTMHFIHVKMDHREIRREFANQGHLFRYCYLFQHLFKPGIDFPLKYLGMASPCVFQQLIHD